MHLDIIFFQVLLIHTFISVMQDVQKTSLLISVRSPKRLWLVV